MWKSTVVTRDESGFLHFQSDYQTVEQRRQHGKNMRTETPRGAHSAWNSPGEQRDPIEILEKSNAGRLESLIPIRYGRMLKSPFAFFRGSASLMAYDLSMTPRSGIPVQACGDCHLSNFGLFATPERNLIFDLNDFDETHPAPFEWDLKRLVASFSIASQGNRYTDNETKEVVLACLVEYREAMEKFSSMKILDVWYTKLRIEDIIAASKSEEARKKREKIAEKARKRVSEYVFPKISENVDGKWRIIDQPPLIYHPTFETGIEDRILPMLNEYYQTLSKNHQYLLSRYRIEDYVIRVVGVGSVGTLCGLLLFIGQNEGPLLLQLKEARPSVLEPYTSPCTYRHQGERVVEGQRLMQSASDALLGWTSGPYGRHFYIRQYRDMKYSLEIESLLAHELLSYAKVCGWTLARAHARGGDAAAISGYIGKSDSFDRALLSFAKDYAKQNERDYQCLKASEKEGKIVAMKE